MTHQSTLYSPWPDVRTTQGDLFAGQGVPTGLSCAECGTELLETECGYAACPNGHGRLLLLSEPAQGWFPEDTPEDES